MSELPGEKLHSMAFFGRIVKPFVPFCRFAVYKRTLIYVEFGIAGKLTGYFFPVIPHITSRGHISLDVECRKIHATYRTR
jgi:hypothetical protein